MSGIFSLAVLISGRGSNLKALIEKAQNYSVTHVFSDNPEAPGLSFAKDAGIKATVFSRADFASKDALLTSIFAAVAKAPVNLIALAGFMRIVPADFIASNRGRIVNIHPSLLPDLPGLRTHERAIAEKRKEHGCTVHFVDEGIDTGSRVAQAKVQVLPSDTFESLASRVIEREHELYPWVVSGIASGAINFKSGKVEFSESIKKDAKIRDFILPGA